MKNIATNHRMPLLAMAMALAARLAISPAFAAGTASLPPLDNLYFETTNGRTVIPPSFLDAAEKDGHAETNLGQRMLHLTLRRKGKNFDFELIAKPDADITKWGVSVAADPDEFFTGVMERVVDGPQQASWAPGITAAMNLRGEKVDMILKPTTSVYAPFYLSSKGYAVFYQGDWPGQFDFCATDASRVQMDFEGPTFNLKFYTDATPAQLVTAHALDAGPPFLPPKWMYLPWRWRDENTQRSKYYDGTPVTGPFNSEFMEDVLLMKAYGIPLGVLWMDRPWGPGPNGYDDFEIDEQRLPHFAESIKWLNEQNIQMMMWIGPFLQGKMATEGLAKGYTLAGQKPSRNNYPMVDFTNPQAKKFWQDGVAKLLKMNVAAFKLDRSEEEIPESGPYHVFDGRSIRENREAYPPMYVRAAYDVARQYRGNDFFCMPRAAYTGSSPYGVFWGGDVAGRQEGLRAEIIAVQRAAIMGYPNWGSDTCGYANNLMETEVCGRWLAFSCFTPIMEVGPTKNVAFWDFHDPPSYDAQLIALWRLYGRLHARLADYSYNCALEAKSTGMPIVRPLILVDPKAPAAWTNWWTYQYGPDLLVSPVWQKGQTTQQVYLPSGQRWHDAWRPDKIYDGGQTITVQAEPHQIPLFERVGSKLLLGDLNREWQESLEAANRKPDLKALDAGVKQWFDSKYPGQK
jgi:alpha-D-xyloside xylohydrolase